MIISDRFDDIVACRRRTITIGQVTAPWPFPIAYDLYSSSAMVFGVPVYGSNSPKYVRLAHRLFRRLADARYWLLYRFHPAHRYHMIDTGLGYNYHERDERLLHGAMACLIGYVEDCERSGCHDPGNEARAILEWWRVERPADQAQHAAWMHEVYNDRKLEWKPVEGEPRLSEVVFPELSEEEEAKQKAMWALHDKMDQDEQDYLHRLINIRQSMWT